MKQQGGQSGFGIIGMIVVVVAIAAIGTVGSFAYQHSKSKTSSANSSDSNHLQGAVTKPSNDGFQLPSNWSWYTNAQVGFKLAYPDSWGQPTILSYPADTGTYFSINFYPPPKYNGANPYDSRTPVTVLFQSDNYSYRHCNDAGCNTSTASPTKASILKVLDTIASGAYDAKTNGVLLSHDSSSYDIIHTQLPNGGDTTDSLVENKIVSLDKMGISGAYIDYGIINAPASCKVNAPSANSDQLCLNQNIVDTVAQFADSIQAY